MLQRIALTSVLAIGWIGCVVDTSTTATALAEPGDDGTGTAVMSVVDCALNDDGTDLATQLEACTFPIDDKEMVTIEVAIVTQRTGATEQAAKDATKTALDKRVKEVIDAAVLLGGSGKEVGTRPDPITRKIENTWYAAQSAKVELKLPKPK